MADATISGSNVPRSVVESALRAYRPAAQPYFERETAATHQSLSDNFARTEGATLGEMKQHADVARAAASKSIAVNTLKVGLCVAGAAVGGLILHNAFGYFVDPLPLARELGSVQAFNGACAGTFTSLVGMVIAAKVGIESWRNGRAAVAEEKTQTQVGQALEGWGQYLTETHQAP